MGKKTKNFTPSLPSDEGLRFSFQYYDTRQQDYCISSWSEEQILKALGRLKDISSKSFDQLKQGGRVYSFGSVNWARTIKPNGFPDAKANNVGEPFHFALIGVNNQLARVFGAYQKGVFYIVWFDINHDILPTPLKYT